MAAPEEFEVRECLRVHLIDVVRLLESGNHDSDTSDYTVFRLDLVLNVLARYLDTEGTGAGARITPLVREAREMVTSANDSPDAFCSRSIFTEQYGRPRQNVPQEQLQFLLERRFKTPQVAALLGVSQRTVERRLREYNMHTSISYSHISVQDLDAVINDILTNFPHTGYKRMTGFLRARGQEVLQIEIWI